MTLVRALLTHKLSVAKHGCGGYYATLAPYGDLIPCLTGVEADGDTPDEAIAAVLVELEREGEAVQS